MANHPQAAKRNRQRIKRQAHHRHFRTRMRGLIKIVREAIQGNDPKGAQEALTSTIPMISRCGQQTVIHPKKASRLISRLQRAVNKMPSA